MNRLDRYIAATVVAGAAVALLIILSLTVVFEFIDETGEVGEGGYGLATALLYVLLIAPQRAHEAFPIATLIGALVGLGGLAARHELVAMRAAGASVFAIARAVVGGGMVLAVLALALGEWVAPPAERLARQLRADALEGRVSSAIAGGFWVRDGERFIHVERAPRPDVIEGVSVYAIRDGALDSLLRARRGVYTRDAWQLRDVERVEFRAQRVVTRTQPRATLASGIAPGMLEVVVMPPQALALTDLHAYIGHLEANGLDSAQYRLAFWVKIATPLATLTMLVLTVPLVFGTLRRVGAGQQIFVGVLIGVAFFLANRLLANAGLIYGLPPLFSALAPTAVFLAVGLWGLSRVR